MQKAIHHPGYKSKNKPQSEQTADPSKYPQYKKNGKTFNDKSCKFCGNVFSPKAPSHLYCSQKCADEAYTTARLKRDYGITYKEVAEMYNNQKGKCAICNDDGFSMKPEHELKLVIDHDHATGKVRGMLCHNCNRALGLLQDNKEVLKNALKYLDK